MTEAKQSTLTSDFVAHLVNHNRSVVYNNVTVFFDEDYDARVYFFIDALTQKERDLLIFVSEHEGNIILFWSKTPKAWLEKDGVEINHKGEFIDWWSITNYERYKNTPNPSRIILSQTRYVICKRQNWKCNYCHCSLKFNKDSAWEGVIAHIDHIFPYSRRDEYIHGNALINEDENLQALCPKCNLSKSKSPVK